MPSAARSATAPGAASAADDVGRDDLDRCARRRRRRRSRVGRRAARRGARRCRLGPGSPTADRPRRPRIVVSSPARQARPSTRRRRCRATASQRRAVRLIAAPSSRSWPRRGSPRARSSVPDAHRCHESSEPGAEVDGEHGHSVERHVDERERDRGDPDGHDRPRAARAPRRPRGGTAPPRRRRRAARAAATTRRRGDATGRPPATSATAMAARPIASTSDGAQHRPAGGHGHEQRAHEDRDAWSRRAPTTRPCAPSAGNQMRARAAGRRRSPRGRAWRGRRAIGPGAMPCSHGRAAHDFTSNVTAASTRGSNGAWSLATNSTCSRCSPGVSPVQQLRGAGCHRDELPVEHDVQMPLVGLQVGGGLVDDLGALQVDLELGGVAREALAVLGARRS